MTDDQQRFMEEFETWARSKGMPTHRRDYPLSERLGEYGDAYTAKYWETWQAAITAAMRAAPEWQPIETAPEGRLAVVGWLDTEDSHYPENYDFDYLEGGLWAKHEDCIEHAHAVAPPGSQMPKEQPPYQWWLDLPAFPDARPQGVKD